MQIQEMSNSSNRYLNELNDTKEREKTSRNDSDNKGRAHESEKQRFTMLLREKDSELEDLRRRLDEKIKENQQLSDNIRLLAVELERHRSLIAGKDAEIARLTRDLQTEVHKTDTLNERIKDLMEENRKLQLYIQEINNKVTQLTIELRKFGDYDKMLADLANFEK